MEVDMSLRREVRCQDSYYHRVLAIDNKNNYAKMTKLFDPLGPQQFISLYQLRDEYRHVLKRNCVSMPQEKIPLNKLVDEDTLPPLLQQLTQEEDVTSFNTPAQKQIFEQHSAGGAPLRRGGEWRVVGASSCQLFKSCLARAILFILQLLTWTVQFERVSQVNE
ncbi:hypothetical protein J6590_101702 [Homalodisca vitripennis]|nr:hypothetical protein J6590_101702 [Homalodisca vitripennis]